VGVIGLLLPDRSNNDSGSVYIFKLFLSDMGEGEGDGE
jgi:hypothetical protein